MPYDHGRTCSIPRFHPVSRSGAAAGWAHACRVGLLFVALGLAFVSPASGQDAPANVASTAAETPARAAHPAAPAPVATEVPANLLDLPAWLDYKSRNHFAALPQEARLFYRRGLMMNLSGSRDEALRLVRGASELDPSYVAPHLTLASWFLLHEPSQALLQYAGILELARQNFALQLALASNALYLAMQALFLALVAAGMLLVVLHHRELRHGWTEYLSRFISPSTARWWSWSFLILPYFAGLGPALPTVVFLGFAWPSLRVRERMLFVALVAAMGLVPLGSAQLERLTLPLREDQAPLYGVALVENEPWSPERAHELEQRAQTHPQNPYAQFASGWMARRGGDLPAAETAYRRALLLWPADDRVAVNLGNTLAMQGHPDDALTFYLAAVDHDPSNAAAWFDASQIYTQRFDYHAATDAITRASALNFELVKTYQSQATNDGVLPLVDQWIAPRTFWATLSQPGLPLRSESLPPGWRSRIECSGWSFSILAVLLAILAVVAGLKQQDSIPLRACSNCGAIICRRCARRRRETALCPDCAAVEARAESPEFARVLLLQQRRKTRAATHMLRTGLATLIPGFGLLSFRRVLRPVLLLTLTAVLVSGALNLGPPFTFEPRIALADQTIPVPVLVGLWVGLYALSIFGYLVQVRRADAAEAALAAPVRSRTTAPRHTTAAAA
jgi:tetratricopeptide (TPR) repeat protein